MKSTSDGFDRPDDYRGTGSATQNNTLQSHMNMSPPVGCSTPTGTLTSNASPFHMVIAARVPEGILTGEIIDADLRPHLTQSLY